MRIITLSTGREVHWGLEYPAEGNDRFPNGTHSKIQLRWALLEKNGKPWPVSMDERTEAMTMINETLHGKKENTDGIPAASDSQG